MKRWPPVPSCSSSSLRWNKGYGQGVLVVEVERLARGDTIDQGIVAQAFKYSETKIITPVKVYDPNNEFDEEYFEFGLFMSRREYKTINRRLQRGRLAASKEGKHVSGSRPYGYDRVKIDGDKGWTLAVNEAEADVVRLIFRLYLTKEPDARGVLHHIGTSEISRRLDALGIPTPSGGHAWSSATVYRILLNPVYIGKIRWFNKKSRKVVENGVAKVKRYFAAPEDVVLSDGLHPSIISEEDFRRAAEVMGQNVPAVGGVVPRTGGGHCRAGGEGLCRAAARADRGGEGAGQMSKKTGKRENFC